MSCSEAATQTFSPDPAAAKEAEKRHNDARQAAEAAKQALGVVSAKLANGLAALLTPSEVEMLLDAHPKVKQQVQQQALNSVCQNMNAADVVSEMTSTGMTFTQLKGVRRLVVNSTKTSGFPADCAPFVAPHVVEATQKEIQQHIDATMRIFSTSGPENSIGWQNHVGHILDAFIKLHDYKHQLDYPGLNTLAMAFYTDKTPFYQSNRSVILGGVNDMTDLVYRGALPNTFQSRNESIMLAAIESNAESRAVMEAHYKEAVGIMKLHEEGLQHRCDFLSMKSEYLEAQHAAASARLLLEQGHQSACQQQPSPASTAVIAQLRALGASTPAAMQAVRAVKAAKAAAIGTRPIIRRSAVSPAAVSPLRTPGQQRKAQQQQQQQQPQEQQDDTHMSSAADPGTFLAATTPAPTTPGAFDACPVVVDVEMVTGLEQRAQELLDNLHAWLQDAEQRGWVHKGNGQYFFIEWHLVPDLACLKATLDIDSGDGSFSYPCPICMCPHDQLGSEDEFDDRDLSKGIFGFLPKHRIHACAMHCHHRICERLLLAILLHVDGKMPKDPSTRLPKASGKQYAAALELRNNVLSVLNGKGAITLTRGNASFECQGMSINGGYCRFDYDSRTQRLKIIPMNGAECDRFLEHAEGLIKYVFWQSGDQVHRAKLIACINKWKEASSYLKKPILTTSERADAKAACVTFVRLWRDRGGSVTHYMHILLKHTDWFFSDDPDGEDTGSCPCWWTTQGHEAKHGLCKWVFRHKTSHNKAIYVAYCTVEGELQSKLLLSSMAPGLYQLMRWQWLQLHVRLRDVKVMVQDGCVQLNVSDLANLHLIDDRFDDDHVWSEKEILQTLGMPDYLRIHLTGHGQVEHAVRVSVYKLAYIAAYKFAAAGGDASSYQAGQPGVRMSDYMTGRRHCAAERTELDMLYEYDRARERNKQQAVAAINSHTTFELFMPDNHYYSDGPVEEVADLLFDEDL